MTWETVFQVIALVCRSSWWRIYNSTRVTKWGSDLLSAKVKADIEHKHEKEMEKYKAKTSDSTAKLNTLLQNSSYIMQS